MDNTNWRNWSVEELVNNAINTNQKITMSQVELLRGSQFAEQVARLLKSRGREDIIGNY